VVALDAPSPTPTSTTAKAIANDRDKIRTMFSPNGRTAQSLGGKTGEKAAVPTI
jgi:hypothetical protein